MKGSCEGQYKDQERDATVKDSLESKDSCCVETIVRLVRTRLGGVKTVITVVFNASNGRRHVDANHDTSCRYDSQTKS